MRQDDSRGVSRINGVSGRRHHFIGLRMNTPDYLRPNIPRKIKRVAIPIVDATNDALNGYGRLVESPDDFKIEIVRWPATGWRPVDPDTGDEAGTTQGTFISEWKGDILYGRNEAVGGHYILGYSVEPPDARDDHTEAPGRVLLWHANYHPDGGQLFFPLDHRPFIVPLALPGDDVRPEHFVCFRFGGRRDSTSIRMSGTKVFLLFLERSGSSTSKGRFTRESRSIFRANSPVCWK